MAGSVQFEPLLRFALDDPQRRLFSVSRWCFRGSIDGWSRLSARGDLTTLAERTVPHLASESYFAQW